MNPADLASQSPAVGRPADESPPVPAASFHRIDAPAHWRAIDLISDLHLCPELPRTVQAWREAVLGSDADALYLLGDVFEVWVGDDARHGRFEAECLAVLRDASRTRTIGVMVGNRDFLLGDSALADAGAHALPDPTLLCAFGTRWVLTHGDALCLDDVEYQAFRRQVRQPAWQQAFLGQPLDRRLAQARQLREASEARKAAGHPETYADLDREAMQSWLRDAGSTVLIHGHTHRPGDETIAPGATRHVLTDWDLDDAARPRAEILRLSAAGVSRRPVPGVAR